ncbi:MAG: glucosamine-6-phosphate deaminase [Ruminococcaceae bacterium]|nr:glucosamine-6-phosphate deaminase [Oscillospiraceae bacterium]
MIDFQIVDTYDELCRRGADIIAAQIQKKPNSVLGLATGSSPVGIYQNLIARYRSGELDFSKITSVNLDEYVGLGGDHPQSYRYFMQKNLFDSVNIDPKKTFVPNGLAEDSAAECAAYDRKIEELGGIDLQLLGIGLDGHIGFNEPGDCFVESTHLVALHPSTIAANARFFESVDEVPRSALTMGIGSIMRARKILLIANGAAKKEIVQKAVSGPVTPQIQASVLQLHPDVTVIYSKD